MFCLKQNDIYKDRHISVSLIMFLNEPQLWQVKHSKLTRLIVKVIWYFKNCSHGKYKINIRKKRKTHFIVIKLHNNQMWGKITVWCILQRPRSIFFTIIKNMPLNKYKVTYKLCSETPCLILSNKITLYVSLNLKWST